MKSPPHRGMRFRETLTRLFRKKPTPEPSPSPFSTRAASADEVLARLADADYELYGREPKNDPSSR